MKPTSITALQTLFFMANNLPLVASSEQGTLFSTELGASHDITRSDYESGYAGKSFALK